MERKTGRDLATYNAVAGELQRRRDMGRHPEYPRCFAGRGAGAPCAVFRGGRHAYLRLPCGNQAPGNGAEALYPFCAGQGRCHLWAGADDGAVSHCPGHDLHHNELSGLRLRAANGVALRDRERRGGLRLF